MTSAEGYRYKLEDKELFERTLHKYLLFGHNNLSAIRPMCCGDASHEIREALTNRKFLDFPAMEKILFNKCVRREMSLPRRDYDIAGNKH